MSGSLKQISDVCFVGIDVSSKDFWAAATDGKPRRFTLDAKGAEAMLRWVRKLFPTGEIRAVMEHTGAYSQVLAALLRLLGFSCALCNPAKIRYFALADGQRSKTDRADAKSIRAFALHSRPAADVLPPKYEEQLARLVQQRSSIKKMRVQVLNQMHALGLTEEQDSPLIQLLESLKQQMTESCKELERMMKQLIQETPELKEAFTIACSVPGIGFANAANICSMRSRMLDCSPKQLAALAGLAPAHRESGTSVRGRSRIDKRGRADLRSPLYMAGMSASRSCPYFVAMKENMKARGKHGKVIIIAIARQLLLLLQKLIKSGTMYEPTMRTA